MFIRLEGLLRSVIAWRERSNAAEVHPLALNAYCVAFSVFGFPYRVNAH